MVSQYAYSTANAGLRKHLESQHPKSFRQCVNFEALLAKGGLSPDQGTLDGHVEKLLPKLPFSCERLTAALVKLVAACDLVSEALSNLMIFLLSNIVFVTVICSCRTTRVY